MTVHYQLLKRVVVPLLLCITLRGRAEALRACMATEICRVSLTEGSSSSRREKEPSTVSVGELSTAVSFFDDKFAVFASFSTAVVMDYHACMTAYRKREFSDFDIEQGLVTSQLVHDEECNRLFSPPYPRVPPICVAPSFSNK